MIVVDSSVWIANLRNPDGAPSRRLRDQAIATRILVGDIVLLEVLQGARSDDHAALIEQSLRTFPIVSMLDEELCRKAARNYRILRGKGVTIRKTPDLIIATFCLERNHQLFHLDRDFQPFVAHFGLSSI